MFSKKTKTRLQFFIRTIIVILCGVMFISMLSLMYAKDYPAFPIEKVYWVIAMIGSVVGMAVLGMVLFFLKELQ